MIPIKEKEIFTAVSQDASIAVLTSAIFPLQIPIINAPAISIKNT